MSKFVAWETIGITCASLVDSGRKYVLEFTGLDGAVRNLVVPFEAIAPFVSTIAAMAKPAHELRVRAGLEPSEPGAEMSDKFLLGIKTIAAGSDESGSDFVLTLATKQELEFSFHLDRATAELMGTIIVSALAKHGILVKPTLSAGHKDLQ